jgi:ribonuclease P protein component
MLPKQHRLVRSDYDLIFKKGRRIRGRNFGLIILPAEDKKEPSKIGIIVTKKVFKKAVDRNKLKRQLRNIMISTIVMRLPFGNKIVISVFPFAANLKFIEIKEEIITLFEKIV